MAISIGDALLKVGVDKRDFDKNMKGIGASLKKHQKAIGLGMVAVGAAITGVAVKSVLDFAKMGDEIAKMAKRTGFSTEALSELRHAAELSGGSLAGLEKASRTLSGTILDAGYGLESYTRAFDKIGVSYTELAKLSPEEQLLTVMEALAGVESESERAALASDLFGRAGTQLLPMLADGAEGLAEMREEAHELGIVFDAEAAVAAEEMTDAMTRLKGGIKGAGLSIAKALIPVLIPLLDKVTEVAKAIGEWIGENKTLAKIVAAGGALMIGLGGLLLILPKIMGAVIALKGALMSLMLNPIVMLISGLALLGFGIYSLVQHHKKWNDVVDASTKVNEELEKSQGKLTEGVVEAARAYVDLRDEVGNILPVEEEQMENLRNLVTLYDEGKLIVNETTGALELYNAELDGAAERTADLRKETDKLADSLRDVVATGYMEYVELGWKRALKPFEREQRERFRELLGVPQKAVPVGYTPEPFQHGGIITRPTLAMLGERGPEAVVPLDRMGPQMMTIIYEVEGRQMARVVMPYAIGEIRLKQGLKL